MPAPKLPLCTQGKKHTWEHVRNVQLVNASIGPNGSRAHIRYRGLYKCPCGARKYGTTLHKEAA